jgi:hypothetical protein
MSAITGRHCGQEFEILPGVYVPPLLFQDMVLARSNLNPRASSFVARSRAAGFVATLPFGRYTFPKSVLDQLIRDLLRQSGDLELSVTDIKRALDERDAQGEVVNAGCVTISAAGGCGGTAGE